MESLTPPLEMISISDTREFGRMESVRFCLKSKRGTSNFLMRENFREPLSPYSLTKSGRGRPFHPVTSSCDY